MIDLAAGLPRARLGIFPTPVTRADRLERAAHPSGGGGPLLVKRDDLAGFGVAGNKTRPLEFLLGQACSQGVEVLVTGGGPGSNFCPAAAMAARALGLDCELVVWGDPDSPNLRLARASGATLRPTGDVDREAVDGLVARRADELRAGGRPALGLPRGGSTPLGAVGFAVAAAELADQLVDLLVDDRIVEPPGAIVLPLGSGGSCAGLLAGLAAVGLRIPVVAVSVSRPPAVIEARVWELAAGCAGLLGTPVPTGGLEIVDARGAGFGKASDCEGERALMALRTEGLLMDQTYGAQTLRVALERAASGPVLFWHTGALVPALGALTG
jgi:1-aminocyclopropane-1-carboxylate deaminase/D-cysteine desulfhydrase-like pyridoxal-dependent ACC family enzyme